MPPFKVVKAAFPGIVENLFQNRLKPIGNGEPFCNRYRLHDSYYSDDTELHEKRLRNFGPAMLITFRGETIGGKTGIHLWVHSQHRRKVNDVDLAAEMWALYRIRYGVLNFPRIDKEVSMVPATIAASKRAYRLLIERGHIVAPPGYVVP